MDALAACRKILHDSGSSFALAFRLLPKSRCDALTAFYAFCRKLDDEVDGAANPADAARAVEAWKRRVDDVFSGRPNDDPVAVALSWALGEFRIKKAHFNLIIEGVEWDLTRKRYQTFRELYEYCRRVASAVGFVVVDILGAPVHAADLYAELTGIAVQTTNIIRDVAEDAQLGRIYLPREDLDLFGVAEDDLLTRRDSAALRRLLRFEGARALHYYDLAEAALEPGLRHRLYFAESLRNTYLLLLGKMEAADYAVFGPRITLRKRVKLVTALKHRLHPLALASDLW